MPRYNFHCNGCEFTFEITRSMSEIKGHMARCPDCGGGAQQMITAPGMIKVRGGASPTRVAKGYSKTSRVKDSGFNKEYESIYADDPIKSPVTGEKYEFTESMDGDKIASLPSREKQAKSLEQFKERQLEYAREGKTKEFIEKAKGDIK